MKSNRRKEMILKRLNEQLGDVINGEQINQMARLNITKIEDFKAIEGLGDKFVENYGKQFLDTLHEINQYGTNNINRDESIAFTLSELEKKLINLSKANRLLYLGKTSPKTSFDLYSLEEHVFFEFLYKQKDYQLIDTSKSTDETREAEQKRYQDLDKLIRNIESIQKNTGQEDFYVGYPFVVGKFAMEPFIVRAPLALFPIKVKKTNHKISIKVNLDKDTYINTNLLVAKAKFTNDPTPIGESIFENVDETTFVSDLIEFYGLQNLSIRPSQQHLIPFTNKIADDFKEVVEGDFMIEPVAILGHFPHHATSIQRDFHKLVEQDSLPNHLNTLLETFNEDTTTLEPQDVMDEIKYQESDLTYINALNASQEQVSIAVKKGNSLVIEGPPGTGKSQTITNIISEALASNKKILMVSEKKAAIDVVYSRLSKLNTFSLILDSMSDKNNFYQQIETLYKLDRKVEIAQDLANINNDIDTTMAQLEDLKNSLIQEDNGDRIIDLYSVVTKMDYTSPDGFKKYQQLKETVAEEFVEMSYQALESNLSSINNQSLQSQLILNEKPYLTSLKRDLRAFDILSLKQQLNEKQQLQKQEESKSFFKKLFTTPQSQTILQNIMKSLFTTNVSLTDDEILDTLNEYESYINLSNSSNSTLFNQINTISKVFNIDIEESKSLLLNYNGFEKLDLFESKHRDLLKLMDDFEYIIQSINESQTEKADIVEMNLFNDLKIKALKMIQSKRATEMLRIIERKRKWPINKFIDRFAVELFTGIQVWLCTPDVVSEIFPLDSNLFDMVIFDEASQMYIERAIPSLYRAQQVVIAGDSKQLRPATLGVGRLSFDDEALDEYVENTAALDEESLLDLARFRYPTSVLNYHYRSVYEELIAFSNAAFYQNKLIMSPAVTLPQTPVIEVFNVNGKWQQRRNKAESQKVVSLIEEVLNQRQNNETLGIITFNASQRQQIQEDLDQACIDNPSLGQLVSREVERIEDGEDKSLFIKNIENVQGDERDIIIFSIAYGENDEGKVVSQFGWLNQQGGENRLNVAITRSKKKIYVVTSIYHHQLKVEHTKHQGPKLLKAYLEYCYSVSEGNTSAIHQQLEALSPSMTHDTKDVSEPLIRNFIEALKHNGCEIEVNVGLASYTIDVAIIKDGIYQLALFFDTSRYTLSTNIRTSALHQDNYLRARGWQVKRIFMRDLYDDLEGQVQKVIASL